MENPTLKTDEVTEAEIERDTVNNSLIYSFENFLKTVL